MKSKVLGVGLGSTIFIFLAIAVLALIRPVYVRLYGELSRIEEIACKKLEEETGLSLSYKSLSPSILAGANMKKNRNFRCRVKKNCSDNKKSTSFV